MNSQSRLAPKLMTAAMLILAADWADAAATPKIALQYTHVEVCRALLNQISDATLFDAKHTNIQDSVRNAPAKIDILVTKNSDGSLSLDPNYDDFRHEELMHFYGRNKSYVDAFATGKLDQLKLETESLARQITSLQNDLPKALKIQGPNYIELSRQLRSIKQQHEEKRAALNRELRSKPKDVQILVAKNPPHQNESVLDYIARVAGDQDPGPIVEATSESDDLAGVLLAEIQVQYPKEFNAILSSIEVNSIRVKENEIENLKAEMQRLSEQVARIPDQERLAKIATDAAAIVAANASIKASMTSLERRNFWKLDWRLYLVVEAIVKTIFM